MQNVAYCDNVLLVLRDLVIALMRRDGTGLSAHQLAVFLSCYLHDGDHAIRDLAAELHTTRSTVSRSVDRLVDMGLVRREISADDPRNVLILRTQAGMALLHTMRGIAANGSAQFAPT